MDARRAALARRVGGVLLALVLIGLALWEPLEPGLRGELFLNPGWTGAARVEWVSPEVDLSRARLHFPERRDGYSLRWTGALFAPETGEYSFRLHSDDGSDIDIGPTKVVNNGGRHELRTVTGSIRLERGFHAVRIRYFQGDGEATLAAELRPPGGEWTPLAEAELYARAPQHASARALHRVRTIALWLALALGGALCLRTIAGRGRSLTIRAFAFVLLTGGIGNVALDLAGAERGTLDLTRSVPFSLTHDGADSWRHMHAAVVYLNGPAPRPLYDEMIRVQGRKFQYPATSLLPLEPLRALPYERLVAWLNTLGWALLWLSIVPLAGIYLRASARAGLPAAPPGSATRWPAVALAAVATLGFYPMLKSAELGQIQVELNVLFALSLWAWLAERKIAAGVLVGLICMVKPQLGLFLPWALLRREWRFAGAIAATAGVIGLVSLARYGWVNHITYLDVLSFIGKRGESYFPNQSVNGLMHRLLGNGTNLHGSASDFAPYHPLVYGATVASSVLLLGLALLRPRRRPAGDALDYGLAALAFTMASPIAWEHHYGVALPIVAAALPVAVALRSRLDIALLALGFVLVGNFYPFLNGLAGSSLNVLQSYVLFGGVLLLVALTRLRGRPTAT